MTEIAVERRCAICRALMLGNRKLYCSEQCKWKRSNEARRNKRRRANHRIANCRRCEAQWCYLDGGVLPTLCPGCAENHRYCSRCKLIKPISGFATDRRGRNRMCRDCHAEYSAAPTAREAEKWRRIRATYGLTREEFEATVEAQGGHCAICDRPPKRWVVDHCHDSGKVRALLCHTCNVGIGQLGDDPVRVRRALEYLLAHAS